MTKLRFGEGFGREAGTCWRLLFAFTLMPWMRKYRLDIDENEVDITYFKFGKTKSRFSGRMPLQTLIRLSKEAKETTDLAIAGSKFMGSKKEGIDDREEQFDNTVIALAEMNSSLVGENELLRRQLDALKKSVASSGIQFPNS